jgi:hypothetical protein
VQAWHPLYLTSSISTPERGVESKSSGLSMPAPQLPQIRGVGWQPVTDVGARGSVPTKAQRGQQSLCRRMSPSQGGANTAPDSGVRLDFIGHFLLDCDTVLIVKAILDANGGDLTLRGIRSVYGKVLASYTSASNLTGKLRVDGDRTDGVYVAAPYAFDGQCRCIRYTGAAVGL